MSTPQKLLPIGTRISHHAGNPDWGHGKGTIVDYNGRKASDYLNNNFKEAVELAASVGLLDAVVESFYSSDRCPYVIRFDPSEKYLKGYKDVYEPDSANPIDEPNIFHGKSTNVLRRMWLEDQAKWSDWVIPTTPEANDRIYETCSKSATCPDL